MICLYVQAPFAAFRTFTAGYFRPTATFITPSAAYGQLLNIGGIESRFDDGSSEMTLTRQDLPHVKLALGALQFPQVQSVFQQVHNYPVGSDAAASYEPFSRGNKYNITPVRREFLSDVRAYICLDGNPELEERVKSGLKGEYNSTRYGVPFLGDNNFMIDVLREEVKAEPAYWYEKLSEGDERGLRPRTTRLTIMIDRENMAKSTSALFAPTAQPVVDVPESAWVSIPG